MMQAHIIASQYAARDRFAQAARSLRHQVALRRYHDPTVRELHMLLLGAATALEAAGDTLPTHPMLRDALEAMATEVEHLIQAEQYGSASGGAAPHRT